MIYNEPDQEPWFDNKVVKMTSVSAGVASAVAMKWKQDNDFHTDTIVSFDSRVFVVPEREIVNYFIWRQKDWERNSLNMLARKYYTEKELTGIKKTEIHELIHEAGNNWTDSPISLKRGRCVVRKEVEKTLDNPIIRPC
ncbi:MAG: hypothetical protein ACFFAS_17375 [Promethearchaeota archaeon]